MSDNEMREAFEASVLKTCRRSGTHLERSKSERISIIVLRQRYSFFVAAWQHCEALQQAKTAQLARASD